MSVQQPEPTIDILMVTYNSPESTRLALGRLLETCNERMRVWLWHNGDDAQTLGVVREFIEHPRIHEFRHSHENVKLWAPTNWLLEHARGDFLSKVDDDNILPFGWTEPLLAAHAANPEFGVLGCWRFQDEDFVPHLAEQKIREFAEGHRILQNTWVEGSCFLMKSQCRDEAGTLTHGQNFPQYCRALALKGWINGWYYPFIRYENLDDPRSPHTLIRSQEDLMRRLPLTAQYNGVKTIEDWTNQLRRSALNAQTAPIDPRHWFGWRRLLRRVRVRTLRLLGKRRRW